MSINKLTKDDYDTAMDALREYISWEHGQEIKRRRELLNDVIEVYWERLEREWANKQEDAIEGLGLSTRPYNSLKRAHINTIQAVEYLYRNSELLRVRNMGKKSAEEIMEKIAAYRAERESEVTP